jgi:hypothetical protein
MDHIPHPVPGQSQTTHHQPHLRRRSGTPTLRTQRRLPRRILRRRSPHSAQADLRRHLYSPAVRRDSGAARTSTHTGATPSPHSQISPTLPRPPQPQPRPSLSLAMNSKKREGAAGAMNSDHKNPLSVKKQAGGAGLQGLRQEALENQRASAPEAPSSPLLCKQSSKPPYLLYWPLATAFVNAR